MNRVEEVSFQVLDLSYEIHGKTPVVTIWAKSKNGSTILLQDRRFRPYFYVLLQDKANVTEVKNKILSSSLPRSPITKIEETEKKLFGNRVRVLRVETLIPETVREYRERVKRIDGVKDVLEADVRYAMRYMIDKNIKPFAWYKAKAIELGDKSYRASRVYEFLEDPVEIEARIEMPRLSLLAFDIEVYNPTGSPRASKDPIIIVGLLDGGFHQILASDHSDRELLERFRDAVLKLDPDIIVGYNTNRFDWPYIMERARLHGIKMDLSRRVGAEPSPSVHGHYSVQGRLNVDIYDYAEEVYEVKRKTLEEISEYFGVMRKDERVIVEWYEIPRLWDAGGDRRKKLLVYNRHDVESVYKLAEKFLPFGIQLSMITGIPLDQVMAASVGFRLEFYLMRQAYQHNELIPNREERTPETYKGAIVLKPKPGVHEDIAVLDFTSMYPNIMIKYNVGPDTLVRSGKCEDCYKAPDVGHMFRKSPPGFLKSVLEELIRTRKKIKEELKKLSPGTPEYHILDERQRAVKVLSNAAYGYMGWQAARWYCKECAEAITAWGRKNLTSAIRKAEQLGLKVIYGDTDSLFVTNKPEAIREFIKWVEQSLGFDIKIDKVYKRVFFTEAKKRYVGLTASGTIDIVGFEAIRGDWSEIAKELQMEAARLVLEEGKPDKAIEYTRMLIKRLKEKTIPLDKLVIWKTLTKKIEEYEVDAPHVRAAKRYLEQGIKVSPGDKIGYIITKGSGKISDRAVPHFMVSPEEVDVDYYIDHQIIPAALRILQYFGVNEKTIKAMVEQKQKSLFDFFSQ